MDASEWQTYVQGAEIIVVTRFSFFGVSGFKSPFSQDPKLLFARERLELRLSLLQALPLASLAGQTDKGFHLYVLTSSLMPKWALRQLSRLCREALPAGNFTVSARPEGPAATYLRRFLVRRSGGNPAFQLVLDDDDGLSSDFIERVRREMGRLPPVSLPFVAAQEHPNETGIETDADTGEGDGDAVATPPVGHDTTDIPLRFVSFAQGFALAMRDEKQGELQLYRHRYPYINLGLAMVGPARGHNLLSIAHRKFPKAHVHKLLGQGRPMYLRAVHSANDSRVAVTAAWEEVPNWRKSVAVRRRFAFLTRL